MLLQIHDEILVECKKEDAEKAQKIIIQEMNSVVSWNIPLVVSTGIGKSWKDAER